jgi:hypothetical protein
MKISIYSTQTTVSLSHHQIVKGLVALQANENNASISNNPFNNKRQPST